MEENILTHYGVKGMKWGVRKEYAPHPREKSSKPDSPSSKQLRNIRYKNIKPSSDAAYGSRKLTNEQKQKLKNIAIGTAIVAGVGAGIYLSYKYDAINTISNAIKGMDQNDPKTKEVAKEALRKVLPNGDIVFDKNFVFHRVESVADRDFSKVTDATYVSYRDDDRYSYLHDLKDWSKTGTKVEVVLKAIDEIRAPSKETAKKIFDDLWQNDPMYKQELEDSITKAYQYVLGGVYSEEMCRRVAKRDIAKDPFGKAIYSIVRREADSKKFISKLQEQGYSALQDYFDKGGFTKDPMILFDPSSSIVKIGEEKVTTKLMRMVKAKL